MSESCRRCSQFELLPGVSPAPTPSVHGNIHEWKSLRNTPVPHSTARRLREKFTPAPTKPAFHLSVCAARRELVLDPYGAIKCHVESNCTLFPSRSFLSFSLSLFLSFSLSLFLDLLSHRHRCWRETIKNVKVTLRGISIHYRLIR